MNKSFRDKIEAETTSNFRKATILALHFVPRGSCSFVLTQKNQKVKAVHPLLENYTSFPYLHPNSRTPLTDSFAKNPMAALKQGFDFVPFRLFFYATDIRPGES
ncbi:MAG: hypothetical protein A3D31_17680 [Candidatus Fluviicola riflensis]|nr:MAG: hypothetical protein CHH17_02620 [Candidatus Fluviicola riflensis]OGS76814.1 MAG: hypothetical protein A3D31_17680 [Candidatus Fluviicola riflensis]OGS82831.1 MAG: hypothetical protein A2724_13680 [Fluviicola sp. RIFCSPHIGHO2_01_FULL_43_53]OGS88544.1 MAG: hypothetical protein A3E30_07185 [Fluviicola sp. RIFCSPHIGHO2_12_FULL_43_24]